jgi:HPr kinase/phosphorylase
MQMKFPVKQLTKALNLEIIYDGNANEIEFTTPELNRPGLALAGFFDYFANDRMQILGKHELTYLMTALDEECRYHAMDALMAVTDIAQLAGEVGDR